MKFGVIFPHEAVQHRVEDLRRYVAGLENAGFDFLVGYDHVLGADVSSRPDWVGSYTSQNALHEVFVLFGCLAAFTKLELVTGVLVLPQRQTALVAKQAADLDLLLDGRFRLGVAAGWNEVEFQALGMDYTTRGARLEEQIEVLRLLWTSDSVTYSGRFHKIDRASINPRPKQSPIPLWMGGAAARNVRAEPQTERVLDRIGRVADGWIAGSRPLDILSSSWKAIREAAVRVGRDPERLGLQVAANLTSDNHDEIRQWLDSWREMGVTHVSFSLGRRDDSLDQHLRVMDTVRPLIEA